MFLSCGSHHVQPVAKSPYRLSHPGWWQRPMVSVYVVECVSARSRNVLHAAAVFLVRYVSIWQGVRLLVDVSVAEAAEHKVIRKELVVLRHSLVDSPSRSADLCWWDVPQCRLGRWAVKRYKQRNVCRFWKVRNDTWKWWVRWFEFPEACLVWGGWWGGSCTGSAHGIKLYITTFSVLHKIFNFLSCVFPCIVV
jgi:hypothetical protein